MPDDLDHDAIQAMAVDIVDRMIDHIDGGADGAVIEVMSAVAAALAWLIDDVGKTDRGAADSIRPVFAREVDYWVAAWAEKHALVHH